MVCWRTIRRFAWRAGLALCAVASVPMLTPSVARGQLVLEELKATKGVGVVDRSGEKLPLDAKVRDARGRDVTLGEYFDGKKPVLLVPAYFDCPLLCPMVLDRVRDGINKMTWDAGDEFRVLTISFDHTDTTGQAKAKQDGVLFGYAHDVKDPDEAWSFCTTDAANARKIYDALGYHYRYQPDTGEFAHNAAIFFVRGDGTVNGFIEGLEYPSRQLTLALSEAADGKIGSLFDRVVFSCYRYDPKTGQHVISPMNVMRIGATGAAVLLGIVMGGLFLSGAHKRKKKKRRRAEAREAGEAEGSEARGEVVGA